jgi:hypothetical protein
MAQRNLEKILMMSDGQRGDKMILAFVNLLNVIFGGVSSINDYSDMLALFGKL